MVMPYSQATARKERDSNLKIIPSVFVLEEVENLASSSVQLLRAQRGKQRAKNKKKNVAFRAERLTERLEEAMENLVKCAIVNE